MAQRIEVAPGGSCRAVWQLEQFTSIIIVTKIWGFDGRKEDEMNKECGIC